MRWWIRRNCGPRNQPESTLASASSQRPHQLTLLHKLKWLGNEPTCSRGWYDWSRTVCWSGHDWHWRSVSTKLELVLKKGEFELIVRDFNQGECGILAKVGYGIVNLCFDPSIFVHQKMLLASYCSLGLEWRAKGAKSGSFGPEFVLARVG